MINQKILERGCRYSSRTGRIPRRRDRRSSHHDQLAALADQFGNQSPRLDGLLSRCLLMADCVEKVGSGGRRRNSWESRGIRFRQTDFLEIELPGSRRSGRPVSNPFHPPAPGPYLGDFFNTIGALLPFVLAAANDRSPARSYKILFGALGPRTKPLARQWRLCHVYRVDLTATLR